MGVPEGHTIHRAARDQTRLLVGGQVVALSPQGRFRDGALLIDGRTLHDIDAHGKHLFYRFEDSLTLHVHLGLFGGFTTHRGEMAAEPRGAVRLRLVGHGGALDLRGPTTCEILDADDEARLRARLGPDPLRRDADPTVVWERIRRSRAAIGTLLMDQSVLAGVGNVYRAEALFWCGIHPAREGRSLSYEEWQALWGTICRMLREGVRAGRIITVDPADSGVARSRLGRGERTYVYRQESCRRCGAPVVHWHMGGRTAWACPACQR